MTSELLTNDESSIDVMEARCKMAKPVQKYKYLKAHSLRNIRN